MAAMAEFSERPCIKRFVEWACQLFYDTLVWWAPLALDEAGVDADREGAVGVLVIARRGPLSPSYSRY